MGRNPILTWSVKYGQEYYTVHGVLGMGRSTVLDSEYDSELDS